MQFGLYASNVLGLGLVDGTVPVDGVEELEVPEPVVPLGMFGGWLDALVSPDDDGLDALARSSAADCGETGDLFGASDGLAKPLGTDRSVRGGGIS